MTDYTPSDWQTKGVAIAGFTIAILRKSRNSSTVVTYSRDERSCRLQHRVLAKSRKRAWRSQGAYSALVSYPTTH